MPAKLTIEEMRRMAEARGGKCLSSTYHGNKTKLLWQCAEGHRWEAIPWSILSGGHWCPICANSQRGKATKLELEEMQQIAAKRGGKCVSATYQNNKIPLEWECHRGHRWEARPGNVKRGEWCPVCANERRMIRIPGSLEEMQRIAAARGGKCLSTIYWNSKTKLLWECAEGHTWKATPNTIKSKGTWCPVCGGTAKLTIEDMQELAKTRGGKCLSAVYVDNKTRLAWECAKGHQWEATPIQIKKGSWCPKCASDRRAQCLKGSLREMHMIAAGHRGRCLSETYINNQTKLLWECVQGHQWAATPKSVKRGTWCPTCARLKQPHKRRPTREVSTGDTFA